MCRLSPAGAFSANFRVHNFFKSAGKWSKINRFGRFKAVMASERSNLSFYENKLWGYYQGFGKKLSRKLKFCSGGAQLEPFSANSAFLKSAGKWSKLNGFGRFKALMPLERSNLSSYKKKIRGYYHRF